MHFSDKLNFRLLESKAGNCKMFWCYPVPDEVGNPLWEIEVFDSDGDDLTNWLIILHKMKLAWKKNLDICKNQTCSLPRGIMFDGILYHGNNLPSVFSLRNVAAKMGCKLGVNTVPKYVKRFGIKEKELRNLEEALGVELKLQHTD